MFRPMDRVALEPISLRLDEVDPQQFAADLGAAFERHGFAVVEDHGLDPGQLQALADDMKALFALPDPVKRRCWIEGGKGQRGYTPFGVEVAKGAAHVDLKEFWHIGRELTPGHRFRARMPPNV